MRQPLDRFLRVRAGQLLNVVRALGAPARIAALPFLEFGHGLLLACSQASHFPIAHGNNVLYTLDCRLGMGPADQGRKAMKKHRILLRVKIRAMGLVLRIALQIT